MYFWFEVFKTKNEGISKLNGTNMPSTNETIALCMESNSYYGSEKTNNAAGVSTPSLEMSQDSFLAFCIKDLKY